MTKKFLSILVALLLAPASVLAQQFPSPTLNNVTVNGSLKAPGIAHHVSTNAALKLFNPVLSTIVIRDGFSAAGDGGGVTYNYSASPCSLNAGAGDDGSQVQAVNGNCWLADFPADGASVKAWGAATTGDATAAIQKALAWCSNKKLRIPPGTFRYTALTIGAQTCEISGSGRSVSVLSKTSTTGNGLTVTGNGANKFVLRDVSMFEEVAGASTAGYMLVLSTSYYPTIVNVDISGWNGILDDASATMRIEHVNFGYLNGTRGIRFAGQSASSAVFGAEINATGDGRKNTGVNNTNLVWLDQNSYAYSINVKYGVFIYGKTCVLMDDDVNAGGSASIPDWFMTPHIECDHQSGDAIDLVKGRSAAISSSSWIGSSDLSGIKVGANFGGNVTVDGTRINGNGRHGVHILGGSDIRIVNNSITANGGGAGGPYDEIFVAASVSKYHIVGNNISNVGDGNSSVDARCVNVSSPAGNYVNISDNHIACSGGSINFPWANSGANIQIEANAGYNQGTWTPVYAGSGTAGSYTYSKQVGAYEIHNGKLTVFGNLGTSARPVAPSGGMTITGLPIASSSTGSLFGTCAIGQFGGINIDVNFTQISGQVAPNSTQINLYESGSGQATTPLPATNVAASSALDFACTYPLKP